MLTCIKVIFSNIPKKYDLNFYFPSGLLSQISVFLMTLSQGYFGMYY